MNTAHMAKEQLAELARVRIAGVNCALLTNSVTLAQTFRSYLTASSTISQLTLRISVTDHECVRSATPHFRGLHHVVVASFSPIDRFVFDLRRRIVSACVSRSLANDQNFWWNVFVPICMGVMGPAVGVAPVHCACLEFNGEGLLIAGASGAGKSTLAVALAKAGMSLISDDWTYVASEENRLVAHGLRVPVKLLPDAVQYFPELDALPTHISMNGELAYEVDAAVALDVNVDDSCLPSRLLFVERFVDSDFRRMPPDMAFAYFNSSAERLPEQLPEAQASRRQVLGRLATLPCYLFRYNGPPQLGAKDLIDHLSAMVMTA